MSHLTSPLILILVRFDGSNLTDTGQTNWSNHRKQVENEKKRFRGEGASAGEEADAGVVEDRRVKADQHAHFHDENLLITRPA